MTRREMVIGACGGVGGVILSTGGQYALWVITKANNEMKLTIDENVTHFLVRGNVPSGSTSGLSSIGTPEPSATPSPVHDPYNETQFKLMLENTGDITERNVVLELLIDTRVGAELLLTYERSKTPSILREITRSETSSVGGDSLAIYTGNSRLFEWMNWHITIEIPRLGPGSNYETGYLVSGEAYMVAFAGSDEAPLPFVYESFPKPTE